MARRKRKEEHENHDRWMVSYADFTTLLFAFFVVLYAISSVNEGKYRVLSTTLVDAFQQSRGSGEPLQIGEPSRAPVPLPEDPHNVIPAPAPPVTAATTTDEPALDAVVARAPEAQEQTPPEPIDEAAEFPLEPLAVNMKAALAPFIEQELVEVNQTRYWVEVGIKSNMLFPSGSARLSREALKVLGDIVDILKPLPNPIHVEGHTDNIPIQTLTFPSNWELSAARAASVVHLFTRLGINPGRLAAIGYGEHKPIAGNETLAGRQKNRRVTLIIMAQSKQDNSRSFPALPSGGGS